MARPQGSGWPSARRVGAALAAWAALAAAPLAAQPAGQDNPLVTDLSAHLIAITSSFVGTELLLFGSIEQPGDVVVIVRGPAVPVTVRRKERILGIWLNRVAVSFDNVPSYYAVVASRPLAQIASESLLSRLQIGTEHLRFESRDAVSGREALVFRDALLRTKVREELYQEHIGEVSFQGRRLFRTRIAFPAVVPVGTYRAEVYLIRDDRVIAAQAIPLFVDKQGLGQTLFEFAHGTPLLYGLAAVAAAVAAGWLAAALFAKT